MVLEENIKALYELGDEQRLVEGTSGNVQQLINASRASLRRRSDVIQGGLKQADKTYNEKTIQQVIKDYVLALKLREDKGIDIGIRYLKEELKDIDAYLKLGMENLRNQYNKILKDQEEAPEKLEGIIQGMKGLASYRMAIQGLIRN